MPSPESMPRDVARINALLEEILEVEFSFLHTGTIAAALSRLPRDSRKFILQWTRRVSSTNIQLAFEFASRAGQALAAMDEEMISAWCLHAMDTYDSAGLHPAMKVIKDLQGFVETGHLRARAALWEQVRPVLGPFIQGLSGRMLHMEAGSSAWTDGDTLYLPGMLAYFAEEEQNFQLYKALATHLWAHTRYGTLNIDPELLLAPWENRQRAIHWFHVLETLRLDCRLQQDLPGLYRQMRRLQQRLDDGRWPDVPAEVLSSLQESSSTPHDSVRLLRELYASSPPRLPCYAGELKLEEAWVAREQRLLRDQARFRHALRVIADDISTDAQQPPPFSLREKRQDAGFAELPEMELMIADQVAPVPESMKQLITSIRLDLAAIPEEYLVPAGEGEYDPSLLEDESLDPDDVWSGTYHEEGAFFYDEWDFGRQHYRKNWCVLRELELQPGDSSFYDQTREKYRGLIHSLHRTFEVLRGEDRVLRRQPVGEDIDIDAFVEALADMRSGMEMSDQVYTRMRRDERNIAVLFMVDMSGSTKGWVNEAERESLVLLTESLQILGDRYAIYGFSGWARKRCEVYRIKTFADPLDDAVKANIAAIEAKDYTRMGAPIRHFTRMLEAVEARTKLLITLSDGKPDDYDHYYRGEYGIEDTRQALFEARMAGIHPFCITIDREGADYLPHMYGKANYVVLDEVAKLPLKVSDIYRRITS
ncbi:nitric oxide reductase activation protein NorD [Thiolapillus sp.]